MGSSSAEHHWASSSQGPRHSVLGLSVHFVQCEHVFVMSFFGSWSSGDQVLLSKYTHAHRLFEKPKCHQICTSEQAGGWRSFGCPTRYDSARGKAPAWFLLPAAATGSLCYHRLVEAKVWAFWSSLCHTLPHTHTHKRLCLFQLPLVEPGNCLFLCPRPLPNWDSWVF